MLSPDEKERLAMEILHEIQGRRLPHVPDEERKALVKRAIDLLHISRKDSVGTLVELIDTLGEQDEVHQKPGDPADNDNL